MSEGPKVTMAITTASLASDSNLLAGRESQVVTTDRFYDNYLVDGIVSTGTSPTAGLIEAWIYGSVDGTLYSAGCTGSDANLTLINVEKTLLKRAEIVATNTTSNKPYRIGPFDIASKFGGILPAKWGIFVVHNTGVDLRASINFFEYAGVRYRFT